MGDDGWTGQWERFSQWGPLVEVRTAPAGVERVHLRAPELLHERVLIRYLGTTGRVDVDSLDVSLHLDGELVVVEAWPGWDDELCWMVTRVPDGGLLPFGPTTRMTG